MNKFIIISGPTAVGKTNISIEIAKKLDSEIISSDSMQIYKGMNIGSAKISKEEMGGVPHHLIDFLDPREEFSVSSFKKKAEEKIKEINNKNKIPIITGGTGLYIDSLIKDFSFTTVYKDEEYRDYLFKIAEEKGNEYLHFQLRDIDISSFNSIHPNNIKRVVRALEVFKLSSKPISSFSDKEDENIKYLYFVLDMERDALYDRINKRVDKMIKDGLIEEVNSLKNIGLTPDMQSMKGIGYKEILYYLEGNLTLEEAIDKIKQGSRNYAKRQLTWFRREKSAIWIKKEKFLDEMEIIDYIIKYIDKVDF